MAIKFNGSDVLQIKFNSSSANVNTVVKDNVIVWERPYTFTLTVGEGVNVVCYRYSSNEPTASTGSGATLSNGSTIYHDDVVYIEASLQSGYTDLQITASYGVVISNNRFTVSGNTTINVSATAVAGGWHTTFSGDSEEFITPDGAYHEVSLTGLGTVPASATRVRISGSLYSFDDSTQQPYTVIPFSEVEIATGSWTTVAQLQDTGGSSELIAGRFGNNIQVVVRGTCYFPLVHIGQITKVEAYYQYESYTN